METLDDVAEQAHSEMDYQTGCGSFGQDMDVAIPAQLRFIEMPEQNTAKFHEALSVHDFTPTDSEPERVTGSERTGDDGRPYYDGRVADTNTYDRLKVLVFRSDTIRIYPSDGVPSVKRLACLLHAITIGFKADITHDPID